MSVVFYCVNPACSQPENGTRSKTCQACGYSLILDQRYVALKKIGKGGFGSTFLGIDLSNRGTFCVIKQLHPANNDPDLVRNALELFERETKTLAKLNHPQIPKLFNYFEYQQQFYLIQEFILGQDLEKEVKKRGVFPEITAKRFLGEMLPVLQYIHSQKVIHRDLKPANIIRKKENKQLVLIDFGAVKDQVNTQLGKSNPLTALTKISVGTMGFAPPEQLSMRPVYASDIYALAATCLYLLTGKSPQDLCDRITGELLWQKEAKVSSSFAHVLDKMLELDVRKRYQSAEEVIKALDLVPYEQELAGGMSKMTISLENPVIPAEETQNVSLHRSSPQRLGDTSENLADAIRKRRERRNQLPSRQSAETRPETKPTDQLTPKTLLNEYARGNRNFSDQNLSEMNLAEKKLAGSSFSQSKLIGTNLQGANLYKANFYNANLAQANLREAILRRAELYKANLKSADLKGANLCYANLTSANLKDANLCGADLTHAKVEEEQLKSAKTNWSTIYPNGKRRWWKG
jgi:serine/threonine-protein kinase